jgi:hypothetical protein
MEYCDSGNLLEHLQSTGAMSEDLTRHYFVQIASAVDYAHKQGWTHRDLKLENILLVNPTPTPPRPPPSSPRSPSTPSPLSPLSPLSPPSSLDSAISSTPDPSSPSSSSPSSSPPVSESTPLTSPPASPPSTTSPISSSGLKSLSPSPALPTSREEHPSSSTLDSSYLSPSSASPSSPFMSSSSLSSLLPPSSLVSPFLNPKPPKKLDIRLADWGFSQRFVFLSLLLFFSPSYISLSLKRWKSGKYLKDSCGSIHYAAPEICFGTKYVGPEVDIWSLGVILYTMAAGYLPFNAQRVEDGETFSSTSFLSPSPSCHSLSHLPFLVSDSTDKSRQSSNTSLLQSSSS